MWKTTRYNKWPSIQDDDIVSSGKLRFARMSPAWLANVTHYWAQVVDAE